MKKTYLIFLFLLLTLVSFSQNISKILLDSAQINYDSLHYDKAILLLKKAEKLEQKKAFSENILGDIYFKQSIIFYTIGDFNYALKYSKKSLSIYTKQFGENSKKSANVNMLIGVCFYFKSEFSLSKQFLQKSLNFQTEKKYLGIIYNYLGSISAAEKSMELAVEYKRKSANIYVELYGNKHYIPMKVYLTMMMYYQLRADIELPKNISPNIYEAINELSFISPNIKISIDEIYKHPLSFVYLYTSVSYGLSTLKRFDEAVNYLKKALEIQQKIHSKNHPKIAFFYHIIANTYFLNKEYDKVIKFCQKSIACNIRSFEDTTNVNNLPKLDFCFDKIKLLDCVLLKSKAYSNKATTKDLKYANECFVFCDELISKIRKDITRNEDKLFLGEKAKLIYNKAINNCFEISIKTKTNKTDNKYLRQAFYFSQKSKSKLLEEFTEKINQKNKYNLPQTLIRREKLLQEKINYYEQKYIENSVIENKFRDTLFRYYRKLINTSNLLNNTYKDSLFSFNQEYQKLKEEFKEKYPNYYNFKYNRNVISIKEIQKKLQPKTALIDYNLNEKTIEIFLITKTKFIAKQVRVDTNIDSLVYSFRNSISKHYRKTDFIKNAYQIFLKDGKTLYDFLIKPIEKELDSKEKLMIIVSGILSQLPFETLIKEEINSENINLAKLDFLIKKHEISYNYSINLWKNSLQKTAKNKTIKGRLLAMAPVFNIDRSMITELVEKNQSRKMNAEDFVNLGKLPATEKAVEQVCKEANKYGIMTEKYLFEQANEDIFKAKSFDKKYILLATHGKTNDNKPTLSGLFFAYPKNINNSKNDGFLFANETYCLDLKADLLVLYACETGIGKIKKGEGTMALSRGFIASGAANIIQTLWEIQDISTKDLVIDLFNNIFENKNYSKALREAKLKMISYGISPFHWSGLVLIGN